MPILDVFENLLFRVRYAFGFFGGVLLMTGWRLDHLPSVLAGLVLITVMFMLKHRYLERTKKLKKALEIEV